MKYLSGIMEVGMRNKLACVISVILSTCSLFAVMTTDPGGLHGFAISKVTGVPFNDSFSIAENVCELSTHPYIYEEALGKKTTTGILFYMWMESGVKNSFSWNYDRAYVTLKIDGVALCTKLEKTGDCGYVPTQTGWHRVELYVGTDNYNGGVGANGHGVWWRTPSTMSSSENKRLYRDVVLALIRTGPLSALKVVSDFKTQPFVLSSVMRTSDPTILDVEYIVLSAKPTLNIRSLAFEDGTRSFYNVIRPETFVNDPEGNPTAQNIGDAITPNVEHKLAWKVSSDWKVDLAKVKFEILVSDQGQLPMDLITIPATAKNGSFIVSYGSQTSSDVFNAMLWYYAAKEKDLALNNGYLTATNHTFQPDGMPLVSRTALSYNLNAIEYVYDKMGYGLLNGALQEYARKATRKELTPGGVTIYGYKRTGAPASVYVGEKVYCVIDVSAGASAESYPVTYLDSAPTAGWGDEYKTTKILLRRIEPGTFNMSGRTTTLTKPYYMGVFQVTQKQYQLVTGSDPSSYKGDMRPVEEVSWSTIRGNSGTHNWPSVTTVDANTFVGRLQAQTGLSLDLPTEAQWEYACRAGTTGNYNNGNECSLLGRYYATQGDKRGGYTEHTTVGSYLANDWGLYDMHGNVDEWCLDWHGSIDTLAVANDPTGAASGSYRVPRGGPWNNGDGRCQSADRSCGYGPTGGGFDTCGFRISRTLANEK